MREESNRSRTLAEDIDADARAAKMLMSWAHRVRERHTGLSRSGLGRSPVQQIGSADVGVVGYDAACAGRARGRA